MSGSGNVFYPSSKNTYADPLQNQHSGKDSSSISKDKIDFSDPEITQVRDAIQDPENPTCWAVFGYEKSTSSKLIVIEKHSGEPSENKLNWILEELLEGKQMFVYWKVNVDTNKKSVPRLVYLTWNPASVLPFLKGLMHGRSYQVGQFFRLFQLQIDAQSEDDLEEEKIMEKLKKSLNN